MKGDSGGLSLHTPPLLLSGRTPQKAPPYTHTHTLSHLRDSFHLTKPTPPDQHPPPSPQHHWEKPVCLRAPLFLHSYCVSHNGVNSCRKGAKAADCGSALSSILCWVQMRYQDLLIPSPVPSNSSHSSVSRNG